MLKLAIPIITILSVASCAAPPPEHGMTVGAFLAVDQLEDKLTRGTSTKSDVERLLGKPTGRGAAFMALTDEAIAELIRAGQTRPNDKRELWFYDDVTANLLDSADGVIQMRMRMQMLMVYFLDNRFDGFMWFSNAGRMLGTDPLSNKP